MAYASGNANNATDLQNAIIAFLTANGWTNTSGALSKGSNHFRVDAFVGSAGLSHLRVEMGTAAGFAVGGGMLNVAQTFPYIWLNGTFPVFYRMFFTALNGADTFVLCVLEANAVEYKYLMFGNLENKVGTWTGGQWMHASYCSQYDGTTARQSNCGVNIGNATTSPLSGGDDTEFYTQAHGPLFALSDVNPGFGNNWQNGGNSWVRCDIDGGTIKSSKSSGSLNTTVDAWRWMKYPLGYQPNLWNGESVLIPFHVYLGRATNTTSRLGTVGHIRAMRMDNYEPSDIITLGTDRWMVLPMYKRDAVEPLGKNSAFNNAGMNGHSGQFAYAIKYDGP